MSDNLVVVQRGYQAFATSDVETLKTLISPTASWHFTPAGVLQGNYRGLQAMLEFFGQLAHETNGTFRAEPQTMAESGDHVFVFQRLTGTRKGKTLDTTSVNLFTLAGVVTGVMSFDSDHPAWADFWS